MGHPATDERAEAARIAIEDIRAHWKEEHGEPPTQEQQATWFAISQQAISNFNKTGKVGQKLADGVARHIGTNIDGLIWRYLRGSEAVRAGNIPNWHRAVDDARGKYLDGDAQRWDLAAEVILPTAPPTATAEFVYDVARVVTKYGRKSGVLRAVKVKV
jgi:hypothetical protein